jgi:hypothetical protein
LMKIMESKVKMKMVVEEEREVRREKRDKD